MSLGISDWYVCLQLENIFQKTSCDSKILHYTMSSLSSFLCGFFERMMYVFETCSREKVPMILFILVAITKL